MNRHDLFNCELVHAPAHSRFTQSWVMKTSSNSPSHTDFRKKNSAALDEAQPEVPTERPVEHRAQHFSNSNVEIPYSTSAGEDALHVLREEGAPRSHLGAQLGAHALGAGCDGGGGRKGGGGVGVRGGRGGGGDDALGEGGGGMGGGRHSSDRAGTIATAVTAPITALVAG